MKSFTVLILMTLAAMTASADPETILTCNGQLNPNGYLELHITDSTLTLVKMGVEGIPLAFNLITKQADETVYMIRTLGEVRIENTVFTEEHGELYTMNDSYYCM